jgi:NTP pyrophosphatase (non-canonical NTP hydrolase)
MNFNQYQIEAMENAEYPNIHSNLVYPALGLAGEAGEVVDKVKKYWRNEGKTAGKSLTETERHSLILELGDVLWYVSALSEELGVALDTVAELNIKKLVDRRARGVIKSEGDNR